MKTLNKTITSHFFNDQESYNKLHQRWSQIVNSEEGKTLTSSHFLIYAILRGKDWRKLYTIPKNKDLNVIKYDLINALFLHDLINHRYSNFGSWWKDHFGDILNLEGLKLLSTLVNTKLEIDNLPANAYVVFPNE